MVCTLMVVVACNVPFHGGTGVILLVGVVHYLSGDGGGGGGGCDNYSYSCVCHVEPF